MTENQEQLKSLINEVLEVVDSSNAGPLYLDGEHANPIAVVVLRTVLETTLHHRNRRSRSDDSFGREPEPWEEQDENSLDNENDWDR